MGFQSGSQIRPELGALDYSGYTNAAAINAQAMSNLGQDIGDGIEKYKKNKEITSSMIASFEGKVAADPSILPAVQGMGDEVTKAYENFTKGKYSKNDAMILNGAASTFQEQRQVTQQMLMDQQAFKVQMDGQKLENFNRQLENKGIIMDSANKEALSKTVAIFGSLDNAPKAEVFATFSHFGGNDQMVIEEAYTGSQPEQTAEMQNVRAEAEATGKSIAEIYEERRTKGPNTVVNVVGEAPSMTAGQEMVENTFVGRQESILNASADATKYIQLAELGQYLLAGGMETGALEKTKMLAKNISNSLGLTDFDISNQELFVTQIEPIMMEFIQQTKGAISEKEMGLFQSWSADMKKTPGGNMKVLKALQKANENINATKQIIVEMNGQGKSAQEIDAAIEDYLVKNPPAGYSRKSLGISDGEPTALPDNWSDERKKKYQALIKAKNNSN